MMNQEQYAELCRSTCLALEISDTECLITEGYLFIDSIRIQLMFDDIFSNDCILCITDVGEIPPYLKEKIFESLLTLNFLTGGKTTGVYAIDPISQRASFVVTLINPDSLSASDLADLLRCYADRSLQLQKTLFKNGELSLPLDSGIETPNSINEKFHLA
jgi:hypothetical protein